MKKLIVMLALASCCLLLTPALASASKPTLKGLAKSLAALQKKVNTQATTIASLKGTVATEASTITALQGVVGADSTHGLQKSVADIAASPALTLSWLPTYLTLDTSAENGVKAPNIVFKGANVHVLSSTSETDGSGLGNLIVGWDSAPSTAQRSGSNNLVCGQYNNFSSYGCFIAGALNTVSNEFASVSGGYASTASGAWSSVSGGENNVASGEDASVSGGDTNQAAGFDCSVGGGRYNQAQNTSLAAHSWASVSGGHDIIEDDLYGWAAGTYHTP
jgi:hypothetical protein